MHEIALIELLRMIDDMNIGEEAKGQVKQAVHRVGAQHGAKMLIRQERRDFARRLLDLREDRALICSRIKARFDVSERQAYRDIEQALNLCQNRPSNGRKTAENTINEEVTS